MKRIVVAAFLLLLAPVAFATSTEKAANESRELLQGLEASVESYAAGDPLAAAQVGDLFYRFERSSFHDLLAARDAALYGKIEETWLGLRRDMKTGASLGDVRSRLAALEGDIATARTVTGTGSGWWSLFSGSFLIIFREGFEALLIIGALAAYLRKSGAAHRVRDLYTGAIVAVVASLALWGLAKTAIEISGAQAEIIEGTTLLLATGVLFYVSYWLVSKIQHARWQSFVKRQVEGAVAKGSRAAMLGVSFLVVFREGFETVLFYEALLSSSQGAVLSGVGSGFLVGAVVLAGVYYAIRVLGMRLPMGAFFGATSALLYWMAFKFAGDGIRELQEGNVIGETVVTFVPSSSSLQTWFGVYPYAETLALQAMLLAAVAVGLVIAFRPGRPAVQPAVAGHGSDP